MIALPDHHEHTPIGCTPPAPDQIRRLLRQARRGDELAARTLHQHLAPAAHAAAFSATRDTHRADDAAQRAFATLFQLPRHELRKLRDPRAWLAVVARNEALGDARSDARRDARERRAADHYPRPTTHDPTDPNHRSALETHSDNAPDLTRHALRDAVAELPDHLREVVVLKHVAGYSFARIAAVLDLGKSTVHDRHAAALHTLRQRLAQPLTTDATDEPAHPHHHRTEDRPARTLP